MTSLKDKSSGKISLYKIKKDLKKSKSPKNSIKYLRTHGTTNSPKINSSSNKPHNTCGSTISLTLEK